MNDSAAERKLPTYFGEELKLTNKEVSIISFIFSNLIALSKEANTKLSLVSAQKILVDVVEKLNLEVTNGWYLFGRTSLAVYDPTINYESFNLNLIDEPLKEKIQQQIKAIYTKYAQSAHVARKEQYKNAPAIYWENLNFEDFVSFERDFDKESKKFNALLAKLLLKLPTEPDFKVSNQLLIDYALLVRRLQLAKLSLTKFHSELYRLYKLVWKVFAIKFLEKTCVGPSKDAVLLITPKNFSQSYTEAQIEINNFKNDTLLGFASEVSAGPLINEVRNILISK